MILIERDSYRHLLGRTRASTPCVCPKAPSMPPRAASGRHSDAMMQPLPDDSTMRTDREGLLQMSAGAYQNKHSMRMPKSAVHATAAALTKPFPGS